MALRKNTKKSSKKNNVVLFTTACVVLGLLIILIIFLVNKDRIFTNLKDTAFFDNVFGSTPQIIEKHESNSEQNIIPLKNDVVIQLITEKESSKDKLDKPEDSEKQVENTKNQDKMEEFLVTKKDNIESSNIKDNDVAKMNTSSEKTEIQLCFVEIDADGSVCRKTVKRSVPKSDSPLTTAITLLIKGPNVTSNTEKKCMSVIPSGTKLLSAKVQNGIAYLNFNDELEFNEYGVEGTIHSLEQIVYTATSFSTVKSVQFLIEGEQRDYLGSEGQWIGSPLSRQNF